MKYDKLANRAAAANMSPAEPERAAMFWRELGMTRQTGHLWKNNPERIPLMARLAVAWVMKNGVTQ